MKEPKSVCRGYMLKLDLIEDLKRYIPKGKRSQFANEAILVALNKLKAERSGKSKTSPKALGF